MATFTITSVADTAGDIGTGTDAGNGNRSGTLREAINFANLNAAVPATVTTIVVGAGAAGGTVALAANLPLVATSIQFDGSGGGTTPLTINGGGTFRGLLISGIAANGQNAAATTVGVSNVGFLNTVATGGAGADGGGGGLGAGGAVFVGPMANVSLTNVGLNGARGVGGLASAANDTPANGGGGGLGGNAGAVSGAQVGGSGGGGILFNGGAITAGYASGNSGGGGGGITGAGGNEVINNNGGIGGAGGVGLRGLGGGGGGGGNSDTGGAMGGTGAGAGGSSGAGGSGGFGGGGGGGGGNTITGGSGGFGGGGGGGGGNGGFGGGGGSNYLGFSGYGGNGGFGGGGGGGGGGGFGSANGNGAGLGGAVFVAAGGTLTINGTSAESGGSVAQGGGGTGFGASIFFEGGTAAAPAALSFGAGNQTFADGVGDLNGSAKNTTTANGLGGTGGVTAVQKAGGGTLTLSGANSYTGGTAIAFGTLDLGAATSAGTGVITYAATGTATATLALEAAAQPARSMLLAPGAAFGNTLANFNTMGESLDLKGFAFNNVDAAYVSTGTSLTVIGGTGTQTETFTLSNGALAYTATADGNGGTLITAVCYAGGTRIRVRRDGGDIDVAVEELAVGDVAVTASGATRPIAWLGSTLTDCTTWDDPRQVRPIRIAAHAFGEGKPVRDLFVSPDHALAVTTADVEDILVPAFAFLNGATITQPHADSVTYWHVELEGGHDILLAEGLAAESYHDCGNRGFFAGETVAMDPAMDASGSCRRRANDEATLHPLRAALRAQAHTLGWRLETPRLDTIGLMVDGLIVHPEVVDLKARFVVPAGTRHLRLITSASVPWYVCDQADARPLGLYIASIAIDDGLDWRRTITMDDPRLADTPDETLGFHDPENAGADARRWTGARTTLPASLWAGCEHCFFLRLDLAAPPLPRWLPPRKAGAQHLTLVPDA